VVENNSCGRGGISAQFYFFLFTFPNIQERPIKTYDFRRPDKFARDRVRTLQVMHETFARLTSTPLSAQLHSLSSLHVASGNQAEQAREKAFEEVKSRFQACSKCGQYGCASCMKDGVCQVCRQS